jgi:hypothetical protein
MSKLLNYLNHLDKNAEAREAFNKDSKAAMAHHGLTGEEQAALLAGDKTAVAKLLGIDAAELPTIEVVHDVYKRD